MSSVPENLKQAVRTAALSLIVALSATSSSGQFPAPTTYVCQTFGFWCTFDWARGVPDGTPCYCGTLFGPIGGVTIDPSGLVNAPTLPKPQPRNEEPAPRILPKKDAEVAADDCYKGLGNCQGSFARAAQPDTGTQRSIGARSRVPRTYEGTLAEGASKRITLPLESGVLYTITGECDSDCDDLDLELRVGTTIVDDDTEPDDAPEVVVRPKSAGTYSLEVLMESCSEEPCSYTIHIEY